MKEFIRYLLNKKPLEALIYESPIFAIKDYPKNYGEYLKNMLDVSDRFKFDAIPISFKINGRNFSREDIVNSLKGIETDVSLGLLLSAPFTKTSREIGPLKFLSCLHENDDILRLIKKNETKLLDCMRNFDSLIDFFILIDPMANNELISPIYFRDYIMVTYQLLSMSVISPIIIHMPGIIFNNLQYLKKTGIRGIQPIDKDNLRKMVEESENRLKVIGGFDRRLLVNNNYQEVRKEFLKHRACYNDSPYLFHTDFWIPKRTETSMVSYLVDLVKSN